jgi:hypothetical protein
MHFRRKFMVLKNFSFRLTGFLLGFILFGLPGIIPLAFGEECTEEGPGCIELLAPFPGSGPVTESGRGYFKIEETDTAITIMARYVSQIFKFGIALISIFSILMLMIGGYEYMTAGGESSQTDNAKQRITQALFGLVMVFLSALLLNFINPNFFKL